MVVSCSAYGCKNRPGLGKDISYFRFPEDDDLCNKWVVAMRRKNFCPGPSTRICSDHFKEDDYQLRPGAHYKLLKEDAVPSIFIFSKTIHPEAESKKDCVSVMQAGSEKMASGKMIEHGVNVFESMHHTISLLGNDKEDKDKLLHESAGIKKRKGREDCEADNYKESGHQQKKPKCDDCFWLINRVEKLEKFIKEQNDTIVKLTAELMKFMKKGDTKQSLICRRTCRRHCR